MTFDHGGQVSQTTGNDFAPEALAETASHSLKTLEAEGAACTTGRSFHRPIADEEQTYTVLDLMGSGMDGLTDA